MRCFYSFHFLNKPDTDNEISFESTNGNDDVKSRQISHKPITFVIIPFFVQDFPSESKDINDPIFDNRNRPSRFPNTLPKNSLPAETKCTLRRIEGCMGMNNVLSFVRMQQLIPLFFLMIDAFHVLLLREWKSFTCF